MDANSEMTVYIDLREWLALMLKAINQTEGRGIWKSIEPFNYCGMRTELRKFQILKLLSYPPIWITKCFETYKVDIHAMVNP